MRTTLRASSQALSGPLFQCLKSRAAPGFGLRNLRPTTIPLRTDLPRQAFSEYSSLRSITVDSPADIYEAHNESIQESRRPDTNAIRSLPVVCPGCGAHSQTVDADAPGFYDLNKPRNKEKNTQKARKSDRKEEDAIFQRVLEQGGLQGIPTAPSESAIEVTNPQASTTPICDRCHGLLHQSRGHSIVHPSMRSIQDIIEDSPHKRNHIYHVVDAADFPMSLIPNLMKALDLPELRSQNRRSKTVKHAQGRVAEVSFIITRSDLLAPKKEQVDSLMPYLQDVLRDALGRTGRNVRLGNVRCVSAKRGWWTRALKEDVWDRGGAGWMVGKVNVGKSALFEVVFPKGRTQDQSARQLASTRVTTQPHTFDPFDIDSIDRDELRSENNLRAKTEESADGFEEVSAFDESEGSSLLPPAQPETAYPVMPLVSSLPGTTASPIRIPFGSGKGELIDLPGIERSSLEVHVQPEHHKEMVMRSRVAPESYTIKPGQSLMLGGLIRITPKTDDQIVLAFPFVPPAFKPHVTGTHKAIAIQTGVHSALSIGREGEAYSGTIDTIGTDEAKGNMKSAGVYPMKWDATKRRTGPLTSHVAGKQKVANLPFTVYSTDILIEGVGWVELACQTRKRRNDANSAAYKPFDFNSSSTSDSNESALSENSSPQTHDAFGPIVHPPSKHSRGALGTANPESHFPEVEVFTPLGKFIAQRRPMNASVLGGSGKAKKKPAHMRKERPRQSIGMTKRREGSKR